MRIADWKAMQSLGREMNKTENIIRIIAGSVAMFFSVLFGYGYYDCTGYHNAVVQQGAVLPVLVYGVAMILPWAFILPVLILICGLVLRERNTLVTLIVSISWVLALGWPLLVITMWQSLNTPPLTRF
jgi:hypothetical protein